MQSFLQHRAFRRNAEEQLKRHGVPIRGSASRSSGDSSSTIVDSEAARGSNGDTNQVDHVLTGVQKEKDNFVIEFQGDGDPCNPHNWTKTRRWAVTMVVVYVGFIVGLASSIDSLGIKYAAEEFGVSEVAQSLEVGLYLIGFGVGALSAGPFSEAFGRNPVYIVTLVIFMIWIMASALAPKYGALIVFRFLAGFFGATPLVVAGGSLSDIWNAEERTLTFPIFANAAFSGPILGPVIGGFIAESKLGWRWCEWIVLIWSGTVLAAAVFFLPETYAPVLLKWKAQQMRDLTGDDRYKASSEVDADSFLVRVEHSLARPFEIIFREPIVVLIALYLTIIYIILFGFLSAYEFLYSQTYGLSTGLTGLTFLGILVGLCICTATAPLVDRRYRKKVESNGGKQPPPEERLFYAMAAGWCIPAGMFWLAWTNNPSISIWSSIVATVVIGVGILAVFISGYQYIIDAYERYAASGLAAITLLRYLVSGGAVVFTIPMYKNLGVHWATTLLAFLSLACVPIPFVFYMYGERIRSYSKFAKQ